MSDYVFQDGWWSDTWDFLKGTAKGGAKIVLETEKAKGVAEEAKRQAAAKQAMPGWILPVAIGGGVLALVLLLRKPKR